MNEVAKSRKQNNDKKEMNERIRELESQTRIQVAKSRDFLTESYFSVCVFSVKMMQETNEQILEMKS